MSNKLSSIIDPRLKTNMYKYLQVDSSGKYVYLNPDSTLKDLQNSINILYSTMVLFNNEDSDINNLDRYAIIISNNINKIIEIGTPCMNEQKEPLEKCNTEKCKYMIEIQNILLEIQLILTKLIVGDIKKKYDFLQFFAQYNFVSRITSNPKNKEIFTGKYLLCNTTMYTPVSDNPELQQQFQELLNQKIETQTQVEDANKTQFYIKILIYVFVCIIIFLIFLFVFKKYYSNKKEISKLVGGLFHSYSKVKYF